MTDRSALSGGLVQVAAHSRTAVVRAAFEADARHLIATGSLYDAASRAPGARQLAGRGTVYAITLPVSGTKVVVRRNRHGGMFAAVTRDLFLPPTRAPQELEISDRLRALGVPTPEVLMYGLTSVAFPFQRADVVTRDIGAGCDLAELMVRGTSPRVLRDAWTAARALVAQLGAAGVRHHDLNVKNIFIATGEAEATAHLLDVDRVTFGAPDDARIRRGNVERLARSARKWRDMRGAVLDERELPLPDTPNAQRRPDSGPVAGLPTSP